MRIQILIIAVLVSVLAWGGSFFATRYLYRGAQEAGVIPNLNIKEKLGFSRGRGPN